MFCTLKCTFGALFSCQMGFAASALCWPWTQPQGTCLMVAQPKRPQIPMSVPSGPVPAAGDGNVPEHSGGGVSRVCGGAALPRVLSLPWPRAFPIPCRNAAATTPFHRLQTHTWTLTQQLLCPEMAQDTFNLFILVQYTFLQP